MICPKCKQEYDEETKFCSKCGTKLVKEKKESKEKTTKDVNVATTVNNDYATSSMVIGITTIVLVFVFQIFIIPLSIIGLILAVTSKKSSKKTAGLVLNIISLVLAIPIFLFYATFLGEKDYVGTWKCKTNNLSSKSSYVVEIEFKNNGTFNWAKYGDSKDNYVIGTYKTKEEEKKIDNKNTKFYKITLDGKKYVVDGEKQKGKYKATYDTAINSKNRKTEAILLNEDTYNMYYCKKD